MRTHERLRSQLFNPGHCHVEVCPGKLFVHRCLDRDDPLPHLHGLPVRFTRLAAEAVVAALNRDGGRARVVPPHTPPATEVK